MSVKNKVAEAILVRMSQQMCGVILRKDIGDLGNSSQINRALQLLIKRAELVRMGKGVYAQAYYSPRLKMPVIKEGFDAACLEALKRLGIPFELSVATRAYNEGRSTQVPARLMVHLKRRFRGHLGYAGQELLFEYDVNHR